MFGAIEERIKLWNKKEPLFISGLIGSQWAYIYKHFLSNQLKNQSVFICENEDSALDLHHFLGEKSFYFPGLNSSVYSSVLSNESDLTKRFGFLGSPNNYQFIVTTLDACTLRLPPKSFFAKNISIQTSDIISPLDLAQKLVQIGYRGSSSIEEMGYFSRRGEIFDLWPMGHAPIRIYYFDDMIEKICLIDSENHLSLHDHLLEKIIINPTPYIWCQKEYGIALRKMLPNFSKHELKKSEHRQLVLEKIGNNQLFDNYPAFTPLFCEENLTLFDYLRDDSFVFFLDHTHNLRELDEYQEKLRIDFDLTQSDSESDCILPEPSILFNFKALKEKSSSAIYIQRLNVQITQGINIQNEETSFLLSKYFNENSLKQNNLVSILKFIQSKFSKKGDVFLTFDDAFNEHELQQMMFDLDIDSELKKRIHYLAEPISKGFYYPNENLIFISENDLYVKSRAKTKKQKINQDIFSDQLATLKENDFVVHTDFGIGVYKKMESLFINGSTSDFMVIDYKDSDRVYIPVYKLNHVQKYADASKHIAVDSLKSKKFEQAKTRAKESIKKLAFDLLEIQAKRKVLPGFAFSEMSDDLRSFELSFPYQTTEDQASAIEDVYTDMEKSHPMDRLICGDVGFGKTEVAMRAAMKAVLDHKQVAILVPTTILCLQHEHSFKERFKKFPINIESTSRLKSAKENKEILKNLKEGKVDIIIGTHKLLSSEIEYNNLGLLIIDEEHRFGVAHKEKLRAIKSNLDVITMTATPIPRTMQLSYLGIKDLSLIQTAPARRQSIKSFLIKHDDLTIKQAIENELQRGGQIYYVHNRVMDIEKVNQYLKELVPQAKIIIAHGQLPEKELENRINAFYKHQYDILIATSIIESGIDIPMANTMIVDRADMFGLAQLHQLRGRIGRSDRKAYCYFSISPDRKLGPIAELRLKALQTYSEIGGGLALASSDLEIRGAGDILGGDQSGHIESIGLELYLDLLKEAILALQDKVETFREIDIQTNLAAYIPDTYIEDTAMRLRYYKKLSNTHEVSILHTIERELSDIYGKIPETVTNLILVLKARVNAQNLCLDTIKMSKNKIRLKFNETLLSQNEKYRNSLLDFILKRPRKYSISKDFELSILFEEETTGDDLLNSLELLSSFLPIL